MIPLNPEHFFRYDRSTKHPDWYYEQHSDRIVTKVLEGAPRVYRYVHLVNVNLGIPLPSTVNLPYYTTTYPNHKALVQPQHKEGIHCLNCKTTIIIYRHLPKIKDLKLSSRTSTYHPQRLQECHCQQMKVLVDHRGTPRIYSDTENVSLVNYLPSDMYYQMLQDISISKYTHIEVAENLLDGKKPSKGARTHDIGYSLNAKPIVTSADDYKLLKQTNNICLSDTNNTYANLLLPVPKYPHQRHLKDSTITMEYYKLYAWTHKILIITKSHIVTPHGIMISRKEPPVALWLNTISPQGFNSTSLQMVQNYTEAVDITNTYAENLLVYLEEVYNLPKETLKYHPLQLIGFKNTWVPNCVAETYEVNGKMYMHRSYTRSLKIKKAYIVKILRAINLKKSPQELIASELHCNHYNHLPALARKLQASINPSAHLKAVSDATLGLRYIESYRQTFSIFLLHHSSPFKVNYPKRHQ